jgi:hypothetical protein
MTDPNSGEVMGIATVPPADGLSTGVAIGILAALGLLTWVLTR